MYKRTIWQDHVEGIQDGTDMNAANFNNIEKGTMEANAIAAFNTAYQRYAADVAKNSEPVVVEFELTGAQVSRFIAIPSTATRNNVNYNVVCEINMTNDSSIATVCVINKQANGFEAGYEGTASTVKGRFIITGGMI